MRRIVTEQMQSRDGAAARPDGFFDRILKYIPADIVAGWVALDGLSKQLSQGVLWGLLVIVAVLAFLWTKKQTDAPPKPPATMQSVIAALSFLVWAFALQSGPFAAIQYPAALASAVLIVYTLAIGLVVPPGPAPVQQPAGAG
jgi:hypothetical protein